MADPKARESQASDGPASGEFVGFANAPVNEDGSHVDFRDVPAYDAERDEAIKEPSSIAQFSTNDKSTDGAPMANVPGDDEDDDWSDFDFGDDFEDEPDADADDEPDADEVEDEAPEDPATVIEESHAETPEVGDPENPADPTSQPQA